MDIRVKYADGVAEIIQMHDSEWLDLRAAEDVEMKVGEYKRIPLGVCIELPKWHEAIVAPRSSTYEKFGIIMANSIGVIDNAYNGDNDWWSFPALAMRNTVIHKNDRIAQFRIQHTQGAVNVIPVEHLGNEDRGGLGSTGK